MKKSNLEDYILHSAHSRKNGIAFDSVECPFLQVDSSVNEDGNIETVVIPKSVGMARDISEFEKNTTSQKKNNIFSTVAAVFELVVLIALIITSQKFGVIYGWIFFCIICSPKYLKLVNDYYYFDRKSKRIIANPVMKFHSAEHMAYNYYNKYKKVPTIEELRKSSRFSEYCSRYNQVSELAICTIFSFFLMLAVPNLNFLVCIILVAIMFPCYNKLLKSGKLKFLEVLVTRKPTTLELNCAIKGLEVFDELEKSIRQQKQENTGPMIIVDIGDGSEFVLECLTIAMDEFFGLFREEHEEED